MNRMLHAAIGAMLCQETQQGDAGESKAPSPETIERMPDDARNPSGPVGRNWTNLGAARAMAISNADTAVEIAKQSVSVTKLDGLKELAELDKEGRGQFILGVRGYWESKNAERKLVKNQQNYIGDLKRVDLAIETNGLGPVMEKLKAKGTYPDVIASIPRRSTTVGGQNKGTGTKALADAATVAVVNALKAEGVAEPSADQVKERLAKLSATPEPKPAETPPEPGKEPTPIRQAPVEVSSRELVQKIGLCHDSAIIPVLEALATRCANSPMYKELGRELSAVKDAFENKPTQGEGGPVLSEHEHKEHQAVMAH